MVRYYITHDDLRVVSGTKTHEDFSLAWAEAQAFARDLDSHLFVVSSNGRQSWEVYPDGQIDQMPTEDCEVWDDTYLTKTIKEN